MIKFFMHYIKNSHGASATEFSLLAPVLVLLLVGTIDFGLFIKQELQLQKMVSETASYAARIQGDSNLDAVAEGAYEGDFSKVTLDTILECSCSDGAAQTCPADCADDDFERRYVSISASGTYQPLFPYPGLPENMVLQSTARMRID